MGYNTQKEAGYIAEILTIIALNEKKNVFVDGSLRDTSWYEYLNRILYNVVVIMLSLY